MNDSMYECGLQIRREVVGEEYVDRALENAGEFGRDFQRFLTEYCWGASWSRDALSRRDRSLLNLVLLGALGRNAEFRTHVRGALRNGVTTDEISDALLHLTVYAGAPAGVEAFRIAGEVLAESREESERS